MNASLKLKKLQEYKYGDDADDMLEDIYNFLDKESLEVIYENLTEDLTPEEISKLERSI